MSNSSEKPGELSNSPKYGLDQAYEQYAEGADLWLQSRRDRDGYLLAVNSSDPRLRRLDQFTTQLIKMVPLSAKVVDLGFGPEGRDMADILELGHSKRVSVYGVELVHRNITSALEDPHFIQDGRNVMKDRVVEGDITKGIFLGDNSVDAVILSSVIQHIEPTLFYERVAPEIVRILKNNGFLQLLFKRKVGDSNVLTIQDITLGGGERSFYVYDPDEVVSRFQDLGMNLYKGDNSSFGGVITWDDQQRGIPYAGMYLTKSSPAAIE